jgi:hypothetical protein
MRESLGSRRPSARQATRRNLDRFLKARDFGGERAPSRGRDLKPSLARAVILGAGGRALESANQPLLLQLVERTI